MQHKTVDCYVDDLAVKSKKKGTHLVVLRKVFERLRKFKLCMNPLTFFFGVSLGKSLGNIVSKGGIELDPVKVKAIMEMRSPKTLKELKGLQGRLAYIRIFISNLFGKSKPFSHLIKKGVALIWDKESKDAFKDIKRPFILYRRALALCMLASLMPNRPFILYTRALDHSLGPC